MVFKLQYFRQVSGNTCSGIPLNNEGFSLNHGCLNKKALRRYIRSIKIRISIFSNCMNLTYSIIITIIK